MAENLELFDIFDSSENSGNCWSEIVQQIAPIEIDINDMLSKNICSTCRDSCNEFVKFREMILCSNEYQLVQLTKEESSQDLEMVIGIEQSVEDEMQLIEEEEVKPPEQFTLLVDISAIQEEVVEVDEQFDELLNADSNDEDITCADMVTSESCGSSDSEADHICTICSKSFSKNSKLQEHLKTHTKMRLYPCKICKRKFTTEVLLTRHEIIHSDIITQIKIETKHRCIICNSNFKDKPELEDHMREYKSKLEEEAMNCQYCDKPYNKLSNLIRHLKTHEENKTHLCNVCNRTFAMGQDLIDHLNRHKGFLPHSCHICSKSYLQISKLRNHLRTHSDDKVRHKKIFCIF